MFRPVVEWQRPDDGHYRPKHVVFILYKLFLGVVEWQRPDDGHYRPKHVVFILYKLLLGVVELKKELMMATTGRNM